MKMLHIHRYECVLDPSDATVITKRIGKAFMVNTVYHARCIVCGKSIRHVLGGEWHYIDEHGQERIRDKDYR